MIKCKDCDSEGSKELHICPFEEEINNNNRLCNCCKECEYQCEMDV